MALSVDGQKIVDRTLAVVTDNASSPQLITYSDVLWQLALEPDTPLAPPTSDDVNRALETVVQQRIFALEADRLPQMPTTKEEIASEIKDILEQFTSPSDFEKRLRSVGFESVKDENFERLMTERVRIKKYIDFRFRAFVVVTREEEENFFKEKVLPDFKAKYPGATQPKLVERRQQINRILVERSISESIKNFLDNSERTTEVIYLNND